MIFLTVGTHYLGFERLVKKMDEISSKLDEEIIAQIGLTKYKPKNMKYFNFTDEKKLLDLYKKARIVVSHAGAGTVLTILQHGKIAIIVPRLKKYNEHIDNHQLELSEVLDKEGKAIVVYKIETLEEAIKKTKTKNYQKSKRDKTLIKFLKEYIAGMNT